MSHPSPAPPFRFSFWRKRPTNNCPGLKVSSLQITLTACCRCRPKLDSGIFLPLPGWAHMAFLDFTVLQSFVTKLPINSGFKSENKHNCSPQYKHCIQHGHGSDHDVRAPVSLINISRQSPVCFSPSLSPHRILGSAVHLAWPHMLRVSFWRQTRIVSRDGYTSHPRPGLGCKV